MEVCSEWPVNFSDYGGCVDERNETWAVGCISPVDDPPLRYRQILLLLVDADDS
jgi:hypothetical protein